MNHALVYRRLAVYCLLMATLGGGTLWFAGFTNGPSPRMLACPLATLSGLQCPTCGGQRAVQALLAGAWRDALDFNPLLLAGPAVAILLWSTARDRLRGQRETVGGLLLVLALVFATVRNLWT